MRRSAISRLAVVLVLRQVTEVLVVAGLEGVLAASVQLTRKKSAKRWAERPGGQSAPAGDARAR